MRTSCSLLLAFATIALLQVAASQSIVPTSSSSTFPACAVNCVVLLQAQSACIPPNVATTNDLTYENCFCQSSLLGALYSTPDSICTAECTVESDRSQLQTWFQGFCSQVGQGIDPLTTTASPTPTATTIVTITSYSTPPPAASNTGTGSASAPAAAANKSWIDTHWKWILMVAILIVGFALLTWAAIWLKRRHRRKLEARRATMSGLPTVDEKRGTRAATPDLWGPHQHMHHTRGFEYPDAFITGSGALAANGDRDKRRSRRVSSSQSNSHGRTETTELAGRPPASRRQSSKGKARARNSTADIHPALDPAARDRSRSQRRRGPESDQEQNGDPNHERRLREVRGARRKNNDDQI